MEIPLFRRGPESFPSSLRIPPFPSVLLARAGPLYVYRIADDNAHQILSDLDPALVRLRHCGSHRFRCRSAAILIRHERKVVEHRQSWLRLREDTPNIGGRRVVRKAEGDAGLRLYRRRGVNQFMNDDVGVASMTDQILGKARISRQHNRTPTVAYAETVRRSKFTTVVHGECRHTYAPFIEHIGVGVELADIERSTASRETLL